MASKAERERQAQARANVMRRTSPHVRDVPVQDTPVSGERVRGLPPQRSPRRKAPLPMTRAERDQSSKAKADRTAWEQTPEGKARTQNIQDLLGSNVHESWSNIPVGMAYMLRGYGQTGVGPKHYDVQLPGMADPNAAPRPPRWEELPPEARAHTERALKMHGTNIDQMVRDYGAQLDQSYFRAERAHGGDTSRLPYAMAFYSTGEPRQVIDRSASELGIPQPIHAQMNAFTSPNTKFTQDIITRDPEGKPIVDASGEAVKHRTFPNDEAAKHAVRWSQEGRNPEAITNAVPGQDKSVQGYTSNLRKAARSHTQWEREGVEPADWVSPKGGSPWDSAPKTGPYANSWSDTHPQFFVSDVHSGGGGMVPHLSSSKPTKRDAAGQPILKPEYRDNPPENPTERHFAREKSQREQAIDQVPFFHSAADYAARQATVQRGLGSLRESQAGQWGEEQLQREIRGGPTEASSYPTSDFRSSAYDPNPTASLHDQQFEQHAAASETDAELLRIRQTIGPSKPNAPGSDPKKRAWATPAEGKPVQHEQQSLF